MTFKIEVLASWLVANTNDIEDDIEDIDIEFHQG